MRLMIVIDAFFVKDKGPVLRVAVRDLGRACGTSFRVLRTPCSQRAGYVAASTLLLVSTPLCDVTSVTAVYSFMV